MVKLDINQYSDFYGIIGEKSEEDVYRLGGEVLDIPTPPYKYSDLQIQYSQVPYKSSCTLFGPMGAVSDLTGRVWPKQDQADIYQQSLKLGLKPEIGWYTDDGVDLVRKNYFRLYNQELLSFRMPFASEQFYDALKKGYTTVIGYKGNREYNLDYKDGVLDSTSFGVSTYGHCLRLVQTDIDIYELIVDNYVGRKPNTYKIKKANLKELLDNGVFHKYAFIFVIKKDFEQLNMTDGFFAKVPLWATVSVEKAIKAGIIDLKSDLNEIVGTKTLEDSLLKLKVFTKPVGNVSLVRWLVALDKLKQI